MTRRFRLPLFAFCLLPLLASAQSVTPAAPPAPAAKTACLETEQVVFACTSGKAEVALCASKSSLKMPGFLHFRLVEAGKAPIVFPAGAEETKAFAESGDWYAGNGPGGEYYAVTSGKHSYTAFETGPRGEQYGGSQAGVMAEQRGGASSEFMCDDTDTGFDDTGSDLVAKANVLSEGRYRKLD